MRVNTFIAIGAVFAVVGFLGLTYVFPKMMCISGQDFNDQISTDANNANSFGDFDSGDTVTISDSISRIQYEHGDAGTTTVWLESIGKSNNVLHFTFSQNLMNDFGLGSNVIITFEISSSGQSETIINEEISSRYSTTNEYIFMVIILGGIGSIVYGGYNAFIGKDEEPQDDWGFPSQAPVQPPVAAPPMAAPPAQQAPAPVSPPTSTPPTAAPPMASESTSMTITVPPGVVSGQVLTVTLADGRSVNVQVPAGCNAGSQFTITVN